MLGRTEIVSGSGSEDVAGGVVRNVSGAPLAGDPAATQNMLLLIQLRWIAVAGQVATIVFVQLVLGISLPLLPMAVIIAALIALNLASLAWLRNGRDVGDAGLLGALLFDVAALTALLYFSGGATNPFTFLYLLQVTLAAVSLDRRSTWAVVAATCASFVFLTVDYRPLAVPEGFGDLFRLHIVGMLVCFALDAALLVAFVTRITR
ncbi:MAG: sensor histidine kinase, partial [Hyphomicrobium sp.]|nr:sensor histidine kinase [Hyphomicrobium sp.]